jgi:hypothetical protein
MAAGLGYIEFATGDVLTAATANGYLASQTVMVFANAAARTAAITSPQEGMFSYLKDTDATQYYSGSAWTTVGGGSSGALTLLSTTSFSAVSSISLPNNTFSATYDNYWLMLNITAGGSADAYISARMRASGTDNTTSNYGSGFFYVDFTSGSGNDTGGATQTSFTKFDYVSANKYMFGTYMIRQPFTSNRTSFTGQSSGMTNEQHIAGGFFNATTSFDSMTFITSSTFTGSVSVYGISK